MPAFKKTHEAFMNIFRDEEKSSEHKYETRLASSIQSSRTTDSYWFYLCFTSVDGMASCVEDYLYEKFDVKLSSDEEKQWAKHMSSSWSIDWQTVVEQKVRDKAKYNEDIARHFEIQQAARSNDTHA